MWVATIGNQGDIIATISAVYRVNSRMVATSLFQWLLPISELSLHAPGDFGEGGG